MKKHFEQAIAFDRDSPLNQRTGLGKKYNELVDEYNALEEKYNKAVGETSADETVVTNNQPTTVSDNTETTTADTKKSGLGSLFGKRN